MTAPTPQLIAVDLVILNIMDRNRILLIKRRNEPFQDRWALPGGFVNPNETIEAAAARELQEETGVSLDPSRLHLLSRTFSDPGRDPRGRVVSIPFMCWVGSNEVEMAKADDDAIELTWMLPDQVVKQHLAFDHDQIVLEALRR